MGSHEVNKISGKGDTFVPLGDKKDSKVKKTAPPKKTATDSISSAKDKKMNTGGASSAKDTISSAKDDSKKVDTDTKSGSPKSEDIDKELKKSTEAKEKAADADVKVSNKADPLNKKARASSHESSEKSDESDHTPKPQGGCCRGQDRLSHWFSGAGTCAQLLFILSNIITIGLVYLGTLAGFHFFGEDQS